jgi:hypothetical protein
VLQRHRAVVLLSVTALLAGAATASAAKLGPRLTGASAAQRAAVEALHTQLLRSGFPLLDVPLCQTVTGPIGAPQPPELCGASAQSTMSPAALPADNSAKLTTTKTASIPTPAGYIAALPVSGLSTPAVAHVHSYGAVGVSDLTGRSVWSRSDVSFVHEISNLRAYLVPFVRMGRDPLYPTTPVGDHPFAVADLTGDGVSDIAVAHDVQRLGAPERTTVDLLDGTDGHTVWMGVYTGRVPELTVIGNTLVIAQETGDPTDMPGGVSGDRSSLRGIRFTVTPGQEGTDGPGEGHGQGYEHSGGKGKGGSGGTEATPPTLSVSEAWTYSTGASAARWLSLEAAAGTVAAGWSDTPIESTSGDHGKVVVLDAATGALRWSVTTAAYPRLVRFDTGRAQVAVLQETGPFATTGTGYSITPYALATGAPGTTTSFDYAVPLQLEVGDVTGDGAAEWVVSEVQLAPGVGACPDPTVCASTAGLQTGNRVAAYAPATGALVWEKSYPAQGGEFASHPMAYDLALSRVAGKPVVLASAFNTGAANEQITAYNGADGAELWAKRATNLGYPLYLTPTTVNGKLAVFTAAARGGVYGASAALSSDNFNADPLTAVEPYNSISALAVDDGSVLSRAALLGDVHSVTTLDVNGDVARDLVIGTDSGAVLALDGTRLSADPGVLWRTVFPTQVQEVKTADVDGDGQREVIVTAAHSVAVLNGRTGAIRWTLAMPDTFQWTTTAGDLDGDGDDEVVVPASTLNAYDGRTGTLLWSYAPSGVDTYGFGTPVVAQGLVAAQYVDAVGAKIDTALVSTSPTSHSENDVLVDGRTGLARWTHSQQNQAAIPALWKGVALAPGLAGVQGLAAAFAWDSTGSDGISHPVLDVYDVASGTLVTTATTTNGVASRGTLVAGGFVQEISQSRSVGVGSSGAAVENLKDMLPMAAGTAVVGGQQFVAVGATGGRYEIFAPGQLGVERPWTRGSSRLPTATGAWRSVTSTATDRTS